jgi:hypothetical protein
MSKIDDGGSAFPRPDWNGSWAGSDIFKGMSLRDWFAGQALTGMHARDAHDEGLATPQQRARLAYIDADAMIEARKVQP